MATTLPSQVSVKHFDRYVIIVGTKVYEPS